LPVFLPPNSAELSFLQAIEAISGADMSISVESHLRVICATNRHLEQDITQGRFRQDLFYRINVVNIQLPSLRARVGDIASLVRISSMFIKPGTRFRYSRSHQR